MNEQRTTSQAIMARLLLEAQTNGNERRLATLGRLKEACDDIVSGRALQMARQNQWDIAYFVNHRRMVAKSIHEYIRMRRYAEPTSAWTGPTKDTIAHDADLSSYIQARQTERDPTRRPRPKRTTARRIDDIIGGKLDFNDAAEVREALEAGRLAKQKFDTIAAFFHKLLAIDLTRLDTFSFEDVAKQVRSQLSGNDRLAIANLAARLRDNQVLLEMGLVFRNGRVKMDFAPGTDLVKPEELEVLLRLAGKRPDEIVIES